MRRLYTVLLYLALPFATLWLLLQGLRERDYWRGWRERFGFGRRAATGGLWVHAVSVGEVQVAAALVEALAQAHPDWPLSISCATPTGRARARALLAGADVRYAPYDLPGSLRRCLRALRPRLLVLIETELWPNLLHEARRAGVPVVIASARLSERSLRRHARIPGLLRAALADNVWIGAQTALDAERFTRLGVDAEHVRVTGNLKFDRSVPAALTERGAQLRAQYAPARPLWVAGSTHAGEEAQVLAAQRGLAAATRALLVLAPRHPQRFDAAADAVSRSGLPLLRRTLSPPADAPAPEVDVLLLDTLGELMEFYAAADVAFVGGSLVPVGGHNLLEPAALGVPVLTGPQQFNSPDVARLLSEAGALVTVHTAPELAAAVARLLGDPAVRARLSAAGRGVLEAHRGAAQRVVSLIESLPGRGRQ